MVGLQLVYLLAQPRLIKAACYGVASEIDNRGIHSNKLGGGTLYVLDQ